VVELAMRAKTIKRANKALFYPTQKKTKPDKVLLESAVSKFLAKGGQITKCKPGGQKP
jgi:hypothetical protein